MKATSRFARIAGAFSLAAVLATSMAACASDPDSMNTNNFLSLEKLSEVTCDTAESDTLADLRATAKSVKDVEAGSLKEKHILSLNDNDNATLRRLTTALNAKINTIKGCDAEPTPSPTATPTATPSASPKAEEEYVIAFPSRDGSRLNADGMPEEARGDSEAWRAVIAKQAKHDPLTLYVYYMASPLGEKNPLENEAALAKDGRLEDGNTYSERGVKAYEDWLFLWNLADITPTDEITFQGSNTGVNGTQVTQTSGVTGDDKSGVDITYYDATNKVAAQHSALNRCTQPTGSHAPHPEGPTDNPPPPALTDNPTPRNSAKRPSEGSRSQGNAPTGGGDNADPTQGEYIPPAEMVRPTAPRVDPAAPAPVPPAPAPGPAPAPVPVPDPAPAPPPEQMAPAPSDPPATCIIPPGMDSC